MKTTQKDRKSRRYELAFDKRGNPTDQNEVPFLTHRFGEMKLGGVGQGEAHSLVASYPRPLSRLTLPS